MQPKWLRLDNQSGSVMVLNMITLTLKGIPRATHRELKKRAVANRRSLNNEIIFTLESLLGVRPHVAPLSPLPPPIKKVSRRK